LNLNTNLKATLHDPTSKLGKLYDQLAQGRTDTALSDRDRLGTLLAQEAYRCLIEEDAIGGPKAAAVLATIASIVSRELAQVNPTYEWQYKTAPLVAGDGFGRAYDFAYAWLSDSQRKTVRGMLSAATKGKWSIGMDALPAWEANMMNWSPWVSGQLLISALAIEGEDGYDPTLYPRLAQMYRQDMQLGFFESGAGYEGMAKNSPMLRYQIALAKRGDMTLAQTHVRDFISRFRLHTMEPWGYNWLEDGNWGGAETRGHLDDYLAMKWAFPDDPAVDFQFRNAMDVPNADRSAVYPEMFPVDWNRSLTWNQELELVTKNEPTTFFCNDLGLLVARSSWKPDTALLYFVPRNLLDGHRHANRNMFVFSALGRVWADYTKNAGGSFEGDIAESSFHSVILIDDRGQALGPPAKFVSMVDTREATFGVGDAKLAYSVRRSNHGETSLEFHPNDFRLTKSSLPWMDLAWKDLPDWFSSQKLAIGDFRNRLYRGDHAFDPTVVPERTWERSWSLRDDPVQRAFRTAGLVRGPHPYALIVDDIQQDTEPHLYKWLMQTADDLELNSINVTENGNKPTPELQSASNGLREYKNPIYIADFELREARVPRDDSGKPLHKPDDRLLLVRVLQNESVEPASKRSERMGNLYDFNFENDQPIPVGDGRPGQLETYLKYARFIGQGKRLVVPSRSVSPEFKVLLFAHRFNEPLPTTKWNQDHSRVTVEWKDQKDELVFTKGNDGRTRVQLNRDGKAAMSTN
jgi:hypothetical protein